MALFGKKKQGEEDAESVAEETKAPSGPFQPDPAKAERWFDHARTQHDTSNFEYAATCWLKGLAFDPANMSALESYLRSAQEFAARQKKPGPSKEQSKNFGGRTPVDRFIASLLQWGTIPNLEPVSGLKAVESAAALGLREPARWIGKLALESAARVEKPRKDTFVKLKDAFENVEAFDLATKAGEIALRLGGTDAALQDEVRNLSAQAAMHTGGFDETGDEGGFRKNIKDAEKQQKLREGQALVRTEDAAVRVIDDAKADYESRPDDGHAIAKYVRVLLQRGEPDDEQAAINVLKQAFKSTREFRWRQQLGDLEIKRSRRALAELKKAWDQSPKDEAKKEKYEKARLEALDQEIEEYKVRVEAFPTDTRMKFELGRRLYLAGQYPDAIKYLQDAQSDSKIRTAVLNYLGQAFLKLGWHVEAVDMLRKAKDSHASETDDLGMELRYSLMTALENHARENKDVDAAGEAAQIASSLAMQRIDFKDVVARRTSLQQLKKELEGG